MHHVTSAIIRLSSQSRISAAMVSVAWVLAALAPLVPMPAALHSRRGQDLAGGRHVRGPDADPAALGELDPRPHGAPLWVRNSTFGPPAWECDWEVLPASVQDECANGMFMLSEVLSKEVTANGTFPFGMVSSEALVIGARAGLPPVCTYRRGLPEQAALRTMLDAQFANWPRCCGTDELPGLVTVDGGMGASAIAAEELFSLVEAGSVSYKRMDPVKRTCSSARPCPLVVVLPGAAGNPWFLYQAACPRCKESLASVLISPYRTWNITGIMGCVDHALQGSEIDKDRVYMVSTSRGNEFALRAALFHSDVFTMVALAGQFSWKRAISDYSLDQELVRRMLTSPRRRLKSLQFHVGDHDVNQGSAWWTELAELQRLFPPMLDHNLLVDLRIYLQAEHPAWFAAWNSLHDVLWLGGEAKFEPVRGTCASDSRIA